MPDAAPIDKRRLLTFVSVLILVGVELVGAGWAAGWAVGGLLGLGETLSRILEALLVAAGLFGLWRFAQAALEHEPLNG
ncbi:MAG: hypothetical protein KGI57_12440 [Hyphomicrobiales bacterium]|nr:hypothetical protein [Hyphomicrobiales bacterium]